MSAAIAADVAAAATDAEPMSVRLHYRAYLAGAPIGLASIDVRIDEGGYRVNGSARTLDWVSTFGDWSNEFAASGRLVDGRREPVSFAYHERTGAKSREVHVHGGQLHVTRNGRPRDAVPAPSGLDVLTALFAHPECAARQSLHTGRHSYAASRRSDRKGRADAPSAEDTCRLAVVDDTGDTFSVEITFADRDGLRVPARIIGNTLLTARVDLLDVDAAAPGVASNSPTAPARARTETLAP